MGMHIILVSDRRATRSFTLTQGRLFWLATAFVFLVVGLSSLFSYLTVRHAAQLRLPFLVDLVKEIALEEESRTRQIVRENLGAMAVRLGQMQAQLMQLDNLGEHLAAMAGVRPKELLWQRARSSPPAQGGPLARPESLTPQAVASAVDDLAREVEARSRLLETIEDRLREGRIRAQLVPSASPVPDQPWASGFGWRTDPFTGLAAMHEGIDFIAEPGTPILAAAAGIVIAAERHPEYGNVVELDHGNGLTTRYAHAQTLLVAPGEFVRRGQQIATVGSTGRSTGPHLHFEVRKNGVAQNPAHFLGKSGIDLAKR